MNSTLSNITVSDITVSDITYENLNKFNYASKYNKLMKTFKLTNNTYIKINQLINLIIKDGSLISFVSIFTDKTIDYIMDTCTIWGIMRKSIIYLTCFQGGGYNSEVLNFHDSGLKTFSKGHFSCCANCGSKGDFSYLNNAIVAGQNFPERKDVSIFKKIRTIMGVILNIMYIETKGKIITENYYEIIYNYVYNIWHKENRSDVEANINKLIGCMEINLNNNNNKILHMCGNYLLNKIKTSNYINSRFSN